MEADTGRDPGHPLTVVGPDGAADLWVVGTGRAAEEAVVRAASTRGDEPADTPSAAVFSARRSLAVLAPRGGRRRTGPGTGTDAGMRTTGTSVASRSHGAEPQAGESWLTGQIPALGVLMGLLGWWIGATAEAPTRVLASVVALSCATALLCQRGSRAVERRAAAPLWTMAGVLACTEGPHRLLIAAAVATALWWALRCARGEPDPRLRAIGLTLGAVTLCAGVAVAPLPAAAAWIVLLLVVAQSVQRGVGAVCLLSDDLVLSSPYGRQDSDPWNDPDLIRHTVVASSAGAFLLSAGAVPGALLATAGLLMIQPSGVEQAATWVLVSAVGAVAARVGARARDPRVRCSLALVVAGNLTALAWAWRTAGAAGAVVLIAGGVAAGWVAVFGRRAWDLVWWPVAKAGNGEWWLAVTLVAGVGASGVVSVLTQR